MNFCHDGDDICFDMVMVAISPSAHGIPAVRWSRTSRPRPPAVPRISSARGDETVRCPQRRFGAESTGQGLTPFAHFSSAGPSAVSPKPCPLPLFSDSTVRSWSTRNVLKPSRSARPAAHASPCAAGHLGVATRQAWPPTGSFNYGRIPDHRSACLRLATLVGRTQGLPGEAERSLLRRSRFCRGSDCVPGRAHQPAKSFL